MSSGEQLERWYKSAAPAMGEVALALAKKKISRRQMLEIADRLIEAGQGLRRMFGEAENERTEQRRPKD